MGHGMDGLRKISVCLSNGRNIRVCPVSAQKQFGFNGDRKCFVAYSDAKVLQIDNK